MPIYIALLRGINVGGKHRLPMKALVAVLEGLDCRQVKTYIQSGNAVFESDQKDVLQLSNQICSAIEQQFGFKPQVLILESGEMQRAVAENPFPEAAAEPKTLHLGFLSATPEYPKLEKLAELRQEGEDFRLLDQIFYLYAPNGTGRSKLAANAETLLGLAMTSRNWRTVCAIADIAQQLEHSG